MATHTHIHAHTQVYIFALLVRATLLPSLISCFLALEKILSISRERGSSLIEWVRIPSRYIKGSNHCGIGIYREITRFQLLQSNFLAVIISLKNLKTRLLAIMAAGAATVAPRRMLSSALFLMAAVMAGDCGKYTFATKDLINALR